MAKYYEEVMVNGITIRFYYDVNGKVVQAEKIN